MCLGFVGGVAGIAGDEVLVIETETGGRLTPFDPVFPWAMVAYERTANECRYVLRELAK
jgi:hypothetical protein